MPIPTSVLALVGVFALSLFLSILNFSFWYVRREDRIPFWLATWVAANTVFVFCRLLQYGRLEDPLYVIIPRILLTAAYSLAWLGIEFANASVGYRPPRRERVLVLLLVAAPIALLWMSNLILTDRVIIRTLLFGEEFHGVMVGPLYLPVSFLILALGAVPPLRLVRASNSSRSENRLMAVGFLVVILFSLYDFLMTGLNLVSIRLSDYAYLPMALFFSYIQLRRYGMVYRDMERMVFERTAALRQTVATLQTLAETERAITSTLDLSARLDILLKRATDQMRADIGVVYLVDPATNEQRAVAQSGTRHADFLRDFRFKSNQGALGWTIQHGEPLVIPDVRQDARWLHLESQADEGIVSYLGVPLEAQDRVIGALTIATRTRREFTLEEISFFTTLARRAATFVENARLYGEAQRRADEFRGLYETTRDLAAQHDLSVLLPTIVERAARLLRGCGGGMYLCDPGHQQVRCVVSYNTPRDYIGVVLRYGEGAAGIVAATGKPLIIDDYRVWSGRATTYEEEQPFTAVLSVPMIWHGKVMGVIHVLDDKETRHFTQADLELLLPFADQAAIAIESARLLEETQKRSRQLELLYQVGQVINSTLDTEAILSRVIDETMNVTGATHGCIVLVDETTQCFAYRALRGWSPELASRACATTLRLREGLNGRALQTRQVVLVDDVRGSPDYIEFIPGTRSELIVPIIRSGQVIGNIDLQSPQVGAFRQVDLSLLSALADQAGVALENARLFDAQSRRTEELDSLRQASLQVTSSLEMSQVLENVLAQVLKLFPTENAHLYTYDGVQLDFAAAKWADGVQRPPHTELRPHGITYTVAHLGEPIVVSDVNSHPLFEDSRWGGAIASLPLRIGEHVRGVINVAFAQPHLFNDDELRVLDLLSEQAAIALENARLFEETTQRAKQLAALNRIASAANRSLRLDELLEAIYREVTTLLSADALYIALYDAATDELDFRIRIDEGVREPRQIRKRAPGLTAYAIENKKPLLIRDLETEPDNYPVPKLWGTMKLSRSWLSVPILTGDAVVGVLCIQSYRPNAYGGQEQELFTTIADQTAVAIEKVRLFEALDNEKRRLELLYNLSRHLTESLDLRQVAAIALDHICSALGAFKGTLYVIHPGTDHLQLLAASGMNPTDIEAFNQRGGFRLGHGLTGWTAQQRKTVIVPDVAQDEHWESLPGLDNWVRSAISVPLLAGTPSTDSGQVLVGVLNLLSDQPAAFREEDIALVQAAAAPVGIALQNTRLFEETENRALEQGVVSEIARALNATLDVSEAFPTIVKGVHALAPCERVSVALLSETGGHFTISALDSSRPELSQGTRMPVTATAATADVLAGRVHLTPDLGSETDYPAECALYAAGHRSRINLPLIVGEHAIGALNLVSRELNAFANVRLAPLQQISNTLAIALQNARLFKAEQLRREELGALYDVSRALADAGYDLEAILNLVVRYAVESVRVTFARILLVQDGEWAVRAAYPIRTLACDLQIGRREALSHFPCYSRVLQQNVSSQSFRGDAGETLVKI